MAADSSNRKNPWLDRGGVSGEEYDVSYVEKEAAGQNVHGEADFVEALEPKSVLDAGCGTGRVGVELSRRGIEVVGVDIDSRMLGTARNKAPHMEWRLGDLATVDLGREFDVIEMAGNVMIFLTPGTEGAVLENLARHLAPSGRLVAGFQLGIGRLELEEYDRLAREADMVLEARYATWDRDPWHASGSYAVSVHALS
ncbi:MAG TPA: class I SAM-dependent methyltransferase [Chloroflexia bacterium]|nr:class I SAM-dependent methyltransferase [Chloroflexia bacterium]